MKNFVFVLFLSVILLSCEDPNTDAKDGTTSELLVAHGWQLEKYTNTQRNPINESSLNTGAKLLYGLAFEFKSNNEVRGLDKGSRSIINRGTWGLSEDNKTLNIDIVAFSGDFNVINITNNSMTLSAKTENLLIGVGPEIHLVFKNFDL